MSNPVKFNSVHKPGRSWHRDLLFVAFLSLGTAGITGFLLANPAARKERLRQQNADVTVQDISATVRGLDDAFAEHWQDQGVQPAAEVDSLQVARRLGLALAGTIPSLQEIRAYEQLPIGDRTDVWVRRLLQESRTHDWLAERLARAFVGVENGPVIFFRRRKFADWLSQQIEQNVPYDQIVTAMLAEQGTWLDSPAVNFLSVTINDEAEPAAPDPILLAGRTARAFLGIRLDCVQCHDDFLGTINLPGEDRAVGGQQIHFHQLAAFFSQAKLSFAGISDAFDKPSYEYQLLDETEESVIDPAVPFQPELLNAWQQDDSRRQQLAAWVTHPDNRAFARATVNRVWAILAGRGIVQPVDDIPLVGKLPQPLEFLADDFAHSGFDLQRLIRLIAGSKAFRLASDRTTSDPIASHDARTLAVFPATRLRPDQIARSVIQSTSLRSLDTESHVLLQLIGFGQQQEFVGRYGDAGQDEFEPRSETVTQRLLMLNGDMVQKRLDGPLNSAAFIAALSPDTETAIETVFLTTLTRRPTDEERNYFLESLQDVPAGEQRQQALQDVHWSLLNGVEFGWKY